MEDAPYPCSVFLLLWQGVSSLRDAVAIIGICSATVCGLGGKCTQNVGALERHPQRLIGDVGVDFGRRDA